MDQKSYLALIVPGQLSQKEAKAMVHRELRKRGEPLWAAMEIEVYPGEGSSLLIARPRETQHIYISAAALRVLIAHCE